MSDQPEWVTIAQAARALGIPPRQTRRYADRLPAEDRREAIKSSNESEGEPLRVRLAAVAALRAATEARKGGDTVGAQAEDREGTQGGDTAEDSPQDTTRDSPQDNDARNEDRPQDTANPMGMAYEMVLREKDARIEQLERALRHAQEMERAALDALARDQQLRALPQPADDFPSAAEPKESGATRPRRWWEWKRKEPD